MRARGLSLAAWFGRSGPAAWAGAPDAAGAERPNQAASDGPLARTGASLGAGVLALALLVVGGYLILRRRQQVA